MNLLTYLLRLRTRERLPMIPRTYSSEYDVRQVDPDTIRLMAETQTRDPRGVHLLMRRHGAQSPRELLRILPPRKRKRNVRRRALALVQRVFGLSNHDPLRSIYRQHRRTGRY